MPGRYFQAITSQLTSYLTSSAASSNASFCLRLCAYRLIALATCTLKVMKDNAAGRIR